MALLAEMVIAGACPLATLPCRGRYVDAGDHHSYVEQNSHDRRPTGILGSSQRRGPLTIGACDTDSDPRGNLRPRQCLVGVPSAQRAVLVCVSTSGTSSASDQLKP
jgi:hypothetical protein